jgi:PmbA protein
MAERTDTMASAALAGESDGLDPDELLRATQVAVEISRDAGARDTVAWVGEETSADLTWRDGKLETVQESRSRGLNVRLYVDGRYSTHSTTDLRPERLRRFIGDAVELTRHLERDPFRVIPDPRLYEGRANVDLDLVDTAPVTRERCLDWLREMDEIAHGDKRVVSATSGTHASQHASAMASTNGLSGTRAETSVSYYTSVTLDEGNGKRPEGSRGVHGRHLGDLPPTSRVAKDALGRALDRLGASKQKSGKATLVVDPEAGARLLWPVLGALSAGAIQQNRSFLKGKLGQRIADEKLTLRDDPLMPRGLGSRLYDGEGLAARPMPIIERGVLRNYYVDTYYARKLDWQPTTGGASNVLFTDSGTRGLEQILADLGEGFLVTDWLGGNCDGTTGDFSLGLRGHRIAVGRRAEPVAEMNITGNCLDLLTSLVEIGDDPYPYSSFRTPTLVFRDVSFSGL